MQGPVGPQIVSRIQGKAMDSQNVTFLLILKLILVGFLPGGSVLEDPLHIGPAKALECHNVVDNLLGLGRGYVVCVRWC